MIFKSIRVLKRVVRSIKSTAETNEAIRMGVANQTSVINNKLLEMIHLLHQQNKILKKMSGENAKDELDFVPLNATFYDVNDGHQGPPCAGFETAMQKMPLMIAPHTYNTSHPDYDAHSVRNHPGKIFNHRAQNQNPVFVALKKLLKGDIIKDSLWNKILADTLEEAKTVPHANEIFDGKAFVENYLKELENNFQGFYRPGWVNLEDALFLYWIVRQFKPKTIVQTGVCNGLSSAFMMLALVKNGPEGQLYVIDLPPIFDSKSDDWKQKNKVYGVVIPEGKTSGWLVPKAYQDRFHVQNGDAKVLLPPLLEKLGQLDMFYHDSDHTYDHMMFEFKEVKKYLTPNGVVVADDISWNASLWDFADEHKIPAYNYKGAVGVACF